MVGQKEKGNHHNRNHWGEAGLSVKELTLVKQNEIFFKKALENKCVCLQTSSWFF